MLWLNFSKWSTSHGAVFMMVRVYVDGSRWTPFVRVFWRYALDPRDSLRYSTAYYQQRSTEHHPEGPRQITCDGARVTIDYEHLLTPEQFDTLEDYIIACSHPVL